MVHIFPLQNKFISTYRYVCMWFSSFFFVFPFHFGRDLDNYTAVLIDEILPWISNPEAYQNHPKMIKWSRTLGIG